MLIPNNPKAGSDGPWGRGLDREVVLSRVTEAGWEAYEKLDRTSGIRAVGPAQPVLASVLSF